MSAALTFMARLPGDGVTPGRYVVRRGASSDGHKPVLFVTAQRVPLRERSDRIPSPR